MKKQILTAIVLSGAALTCAAQHTWSYADCVAYAREHNIELRKSELSELNTRIALDEAKAQWEPTLDFATTHGYSNYPWADGRRNGYNSSYGLNAGWTVWDGGVRTNTIKQSRLRSEASALTTGQQMRTIETGLLQVYINILYAREAIGIYTEASKVSRAQAERAKALMESGKISRVDYAQLNSQYEQDKYALVNAQSTYESRVMELKQLLELGIDTDVVPADVVWSSEQVLAELPPIEESYRMALDTDLQIRSLETERSASELEVSIAKAGRMPSISLNAGAGTGYSAPGLSFGEAMKQGWNESVGVTLSVPILDKKKTRSAVARAEVAKMNADLDIDQRRTELAQAVESSYIDTRSAQARYVAAEANVESASLSEELTNERFNLGYVNPVEMMTAHNTLVEARHSLLQAKYMAMLGQKMIEYYREAKVELP